MIGPWRPFGGASDRLHEGGEVAAAVTPIAPDGWESPRRRWAWFACPAPGSLVGYTRGVEDTEAEAHEMADAILQGLDEKTAKRRRSARLSFRAAAAAKLLPPNVEPEERWQRAGALAVMFAWCWALPAGEAPT